MLDRPIARLGEVAKLISGGTPSKSNPLFWNGGIPWLTPKDMADFRGQTEATVSAEAVGRGTKQAPENTIFIAVRGMSLHNEIRIVAAERPFTFNQDIKAVVPKDVDRDFLYYAMVALKPTLLSSVEAAGHGTGRLPSDLLADLEIRRFDRVEELEIGRFFRSLDDKIELNRRMNETLEAMAQAIFRDWFVDFGPTRRKIDGATDPVEIMGGLGADPDRARELADLFPAKLGDDGLPEGWEMHPFSDFVQIVGGGTPKTSVEAFWNGSIPWFSVVDTPAPGSVFVHETEKNITEEGVEGSSVRLVGAGTTIISARGTVGNLAMASRSMTFNQSCYGLKGQKGAGDCFVFIASQNLVDRLKSMAHGSVFSTITRQTFESVQQCNPTPGLFAAYEELAGALFAKIKGNGQQNATLVATRDLLLPKLMSGEIRLRDADAVLEAAQ